MALGEVQTFVIVASDIDGDLLTYGWLVDGQSVGGSSSSYEFVGTSVGSHVVRVIVSDGSAEVGFGWTIEVRTKPQPATGRFEPVGGSLVIPRRLANELVALG